MPGARRERGTEKTDLHCGRPRRDLSILAVRAGWTSPLGRTRAAETTQSRSLILGSVLPSSLATSLMDLLSNDLSSNSSAPAPVMMREHLQLTVRGTDRAIVDPLRRHWSAFCSSILTPSRFVLSRDSLAHRDMRSVGGSGVTTQTSMVSGWMSRTQTNGNSVPSNDLSSNSSAPAPVRIWWLLLSLRPGLRWCVAFLISYRSAFCRARSAATTKSDNPLPIPRPTSYRDALASHVTTQTSMVYIGVLSVALGQQGADAS
jgi:hypothetical protein